MSTRQLKPSVPVMEARYVRDNFHAQLKASQEVKEEPLGGWRSWAMLLDEQLGHVLAEFRTET